MTDREEAIADCKYALSLDCGDGTFTALNEHIAIWAGYRPQDNASDAQYRLTINEIREKLHTSNCLLKD